MESGDVPPRRNVQGDAGFRRILLVGFMGSGKSTVGPLLASRLGWEFLDFDEEIQHRVGTTVAEIFHQRGEAFFRSVEAEVGRDALQGDHVVLASGGGWAAVPGRLAALGPETLVVWLKVSAETSLSRVGGEGVRPLLAGPDALTRARRLLEERDPSYRKSALHLDSEGASPEELVEAVMEHISQRTNRNRMDSSTS